MRLLLDESVPHPIAEALTGHEVESAQSMGWSGVSNGELLERAAQARFDALVTLDRGFEFEQNLAELPVSVAILVARSNRIEQLLPLIPSLLQQLEGMQPKTLIKVRE